MRTQARFRTKLFATPSDGADQADNGRELALWLCANLPAALHADATDEDWGQRIVFGAPHLNAKVSVCCGHVEDDQWSCFCEPYRSVSDRLLRSPLPLIEMETVIRAIDALLTDNPDFTDVEWFANDAKLREIDHASRPFDDGRRPGRNDPSG